MEATVLVLFILQWSLTVVGVIGNIWVIIAIRRYNAIKRTANKILFINLAVADIGVLVVRNPFFFIEHYPKTHWYMGHFACKILMPISLTFMPASFLTLLAISYSRYRAIVYVKDLKETSVRFTKYVVTAIWVFVIIYYPLIEFPMRRINETSQLCELHISTPVSHALYAFEDIYFMIIFLAIIFMFVRIRSCLLKFSKVYNDDLETMERLAKNIYALNLLWPVVVALFITVTPLIIGRIWFWTVMSDANIPALFFHIIDVLLITNSAINPFIYIIVSSAFRHKLCQLDCFRFLNSIFGTTHRKNKVERNPINIESRV